SKSISDSSFDLNSLGLTLVDDNQLAEAIAAFRKAIAIDPKFADAYFNLGNALRDKNQLAEAIAAYRKAIGKNAKKLGGTSADYFFLAMAHRKLGHVDEARAWYDKGVQWMTQNRLKD